MAHPTRLDLQGQRFGELLVLRYSHTNRHRQAFWWCRCDCGTERPIGAHGLKNGTQSCGCKQRRAVTTHGQTASRTYKSWVAMRDRCYSPGHVSFARYGGRGIRVCYRWLESFANFLADMGERPVGKTLDRLDGAGNYEPGNCRWATPRQQQINRPITIKLTYDGRCQTIQEWAAEIGVKPNTIAHRLKAGWSTRAALTRPVKR